MGVMGELYSMRYGISECWWLSGSCALNWDALAALGTFAAAAIALAVSSREARRRRDDQEARALWLRLQLIHPVRAWSSSLSRLRRQLDRGLYRSAIDSVSGKNEHGPPLGLPSELSLAQGGLHDLGEAASALAAAIYCSQELSKVAWIFVEDLKEILDSPSHLEREANLQGIEMFVSRVDELNALVSAAVVQLNTPFAKGRSVSWRDRSRAVLTKSRVNIFRRS